MVRHALEDRGLPQDPEIGLPGRAGTTANRRAAGRLLAVFCILSWRVFWLTMLNRINPDLEAALVLTSLKRTYLIA